DLILLFHRFAHPTERGGRLSCGELKQLLRAVQGDDETEPELPEGFPERLYEAWAPQGVPLTEGRFKAGFKVYMQQRETWLEQWQFQEFCNQLAEDLGHLNPPMSFLQAVWRAAMPSSTATSSSNSSQLLQILQVKEIGPISDAAYDALLQAYSDQWQSWLEDWISERQVIMNLPDEEDKEVKAAMVVQRHFRAYQARKEVKSKRLEMFLGDLAGTMGNRARFSKLFLQFSGGKNHWTGLPPPPPAFGFDALKKLQRLAVGKGKSEEALDAGQVVTAVDFRRGLMLWNQRRFKQLKKWERARYGEVYVCPCCRGRWRLAKVMDDLGRVLEIGKVVDTGVTPGVASLSGRAGLPRFPVPGGRPAVAGSAARKLPHPNDVAVLHNQVARDVAKGAALCLLPPGSARPALAGRLLLQAAVSGSSTGAPLLLLADDHELDAVKLWLASAAPKYEVIKASLQQQSHISKVAGHQLATILLSTPFTFERLGLQVSQLDYVLMSCSATEIPMLRECQAGDEFMAPFSIISKRPRVVCLLDSTCEVHQALQGHLAAVSEAKDHMSKALQYLEGTKPGQGGYSQACLEDFSRHVSRFPDVVRYGPGGPEDGEELPLGFTGPLQPLKRHPVIRSKQDEMSSEASDSSLSPVAPVTVRPEPAAEPTPEPQPAASSGLFF
ncbi:unnamed protein product, partial [Cladocopium goreaui]